MQDKLDYTVKHSGVCLHPYLSALETVMHHKQVPEEGVRMELYQSGLSVASD